MQMMSRADPGIMPIRTIGARVLRQGALDSNNLKDRDPPCDYGGPLLITHSYRSCGIVRYEINRIEFELLHLLFSCPDGEESHFPASNFIIW